MPTTIQISVETLSRLKDAKLETGARSYDELIRELLRRSRNPGTRFGVHPKMKTFEHEHASHA